MKDDSKTKKQLVQELAESRQQIAEMKSAEQATCPADNAVSITSLEWQRTFDAVPDLITILDREHRIVRINKAMAERLGILPDKAIGLKCYECVHNTNMPPDFCPHALLMADGQEHTAEVHEVSLGGYFLVTASPVRDTHGKLLGSVHIAKDITERKQAEDALRESQRTLSTLISNLPGMAYRCRNDKNWTMEFVSDGCLVMTGYQPDDLILNRRISYAQLIHPDDQEMVWDTVQTPLQKNLPFQIMYRIRTAQGEEKWVWEQGRGVYSADGTLQAIEGFVTDITRQKNTQEQLQQNEERFRQVVDQAPFPIAISTAEGKIIYLNPKFILVFGYTLGEIPTKEEWQSKAYPDLEYRNRVSLEFLAKVEKSKEQEAEPSIFKVRCKDGTVRTVIFRLVRMGNELFGSIAEDITEQIKAQEQLRQNEEMFRSMADTIQDGLTIIEHHKALYVNDHRCEITGYSREELLTMKDSDIAVPEDRALILRAYEKYRQEGIIPEALEFRIVHKDGTQRTVRNRYSVSYRDGEIFRLYILTTDITEAKKTEKSLRDSEERFRAIAESAIDAIITTDSQARIIFCNTATQKLYSYSMEELIGQPARMLIPERYYNQDSEAFHYIKQKEVRQLAGKSREVCGIKKNGREFPAEVSVISYKIDYELFFTVTIRDITEYKQAEEQLRQSQKMEAIGTLAGGIAHDFNNILAAIMGYAELSLYTLAETDPLRKNLDQILKSSHRARDLVQQILAFSRKAEQERKPLHLHLIFKEAIKLLRASIPATIEIRQHIDEQAGIVMADPTQMHQVLMNLCTNAAHAMQEKGGVLEIQLFSVDLDARSVTAYPDLKPGPYAKVTVSDTGSGIDPKVIDRIFDPFFTTKEVGKGTGMGLAVVHGIVKSYGGAIITHSEPGTGSTFEILLPRAAEKISAEPEALQPLPVPVGNERILFVDDEELLVDIGERILKSLEYQVVAKKNSREALELFQKEPDAFDVVITDQTMPHMTGFELAQKLIAIRPDIPIILCTGYSETVSEEEAKAAGIKEFVLKPINVNKIAEVVRRVLDHT